MSRSRLALDKLWIDQHNCSCGCGRCWFVLVRPVGIGLVRLGPVVLLGEVKSAVVAAVVVVLLFMVAAMRC